MAKKIYKYKPLTLEKSGEATDTRDTALNTGRMILAAGGGSAVGALCGAFSIPVALAATAYSVHKGKIDGLAFGLGMLTGSAYKSGSEAITGTDGPEDVYGFEGGIQGFSFRDMVGGAKQRLKNWLAINRSRVAFKIPATTTTKGKVGGLFMEGFGETELLGDESEFGNTEELIGETTEMTISSIGNVRATREGNLLIGLNATGGII